MPDISLVSDESKRAIFFITDFLFQLVSITISQFFIYYSLKNNHDILFFADLYFNID